MTVGGDTVRPRRLLRSDNLQDLTPGSVEVLVTRYGVSDVVDLRTDVEVAKEGDGPLRALDGIRHHHHTLYREDTTESGIPAAERALPWETDERRDAAAAEAAERNGGHRPSHDQFWSEHYLSYLASRPDSVRGGAARHRLERGRGHRALRRRQGPHRHGRGPRAQGRRACPTTSSSPTTRRRPSASPRSWTGCAPRRRTPRTSRTRRWRSSRRPPTRCACCSPRSTSATAVRSGWLDAQGWTAADTERLRRKLLGA